MEVILTSSLPILPQHPHMVTAVSAQRLRARAGCPPFVYKILGKKFETETNLVGKHVDN